MIYDPDPLIDWRREYRRQKRNDRWLTAASRLGIALSLAIALFMLTGCAG